MNQESADPRWVSAEDFRQVVGPERARQLVEEALLSGFDPSVDPPRIAMPAGDRGEWLLMPTTIGEWTGIKVATVSPDNPARGLPRIQAIYQLLDSATLTPRYLIDGSTLTSLRTPAVSAVAVARLAPEPVRIVDLFGTGPQAWHHLEALAAVRDVGSVRVHSRTPATAAEFARRCLEHGFAAGVAAPHDEPSEPADILICATTSRTPILASEQVRDGACVVAVGSHHPDARELPGDLMGRALVVVEDVGTALREAGDVILAVEEGMLQAADLEPLADLVAGRVQRRDDAPNVFKSVGMSWEDLAVARGIAEASILPDYRQSGRC
ncbi:ornithine cyclodeaminase [Kineosphaera limosa]|uniref:Ornithine cyclodeaminase/mu-crystallin family protein n=1 Tax=Kineosphaera limosa NBRC 100340 TaxID=1184609 RepID=K6VJ44_9MICO|nr:ornithine cyclodeaminase family protein [Kineosphaera limosa]NYE03228.1 ornithine cyclodeaminase [Kineosphaera limosa]GAB96248.1 ornithine cyclodeaminase/mu-crystallin family protein [Kineosphaera limosa NBRC 100340]